MLWHLVAKDRTKTLCGVPLSKRIQEILRPRSDEEINLVPEGQPHCAACQEAKAEEL